MKIKFFDHNIAVQRCLYKTHDSEAGIQNV